MLLHTFICSRKWKHSCHLVYCGNCFITVVWNWTQNISGLPVFVDGHLNGFHILAHNAAVNMGVQTSLQHPIFSSGSISTNGITRLYCLVKFFDVGYSGLLLSQKCSLRNQKFDQPQAQFPALWLSSCYAADRAQSRPLLPFPVVSPAVALLFLSFVFVLYCLPALTLNEVGLFLLVLFSAMLSKPQPHSPFSRVCARPFSISGPWCSSVLHLECPALALYVVRVSHLHSGLPWAPQPVILEPSSQFVPSNDLVIIHLFTGTVLVLLKRSIL